MINAVRNKQTELVRILTIEEANKSFKDINGKTPLHHAILTKDLKIVKYVTDNENNI